MAHKEEVCVICSTCIDNPYVLFLYYDIIGEHISAKDGVDSILKCIRLKLESPWEEEESIEQARFIFFACLTCACSCACRPIYCACDAPARISPV